MLKYLSRILPCIPCTTAEGKSATKNSAAAEGRGQSLPHPTSLANPPGSATQLTLLQAATKVAQQKSHPGKILNVIKQLDQGAQGKVFLVQDENGSYFAAKVSTVDNKKDPANKKNDESAIFNILGNDHEGWPKTFGSRDIHMPDSNGTLLKALITEYIDGQNLEDYTAILHSSSLPEAEKTDIARHIAIGIRDALQHAGSKKIEHRDIKPWNIMIERNTARVILLDLGAAKVHSQLPPNGIYAQDEKALEATIASLLPSAESIESINFMGMQPIQSLSLSSFDAAIPSVMSPPTSSFRSGPRSTIFTDEFLDKKTLNKDNVINNIQLLMSPKR